MLNTRVLAPDIERIARQFVQSLSAQYEVTGAYVFGSRARGDAQPESDSDIAILLRGNPGRRVGEVVRMADIAYDIMLETGVRIEALPLWESEWKNPETFNNPALIENIRHDGVAL